MPSQVTVKDSLVRIEGISIHNLDVVQYFRNKRDEDRAQAAVRVVELGVFCLQRAEVGQSLEFVKLEVERLIQASSNAVYFSSHPQGRSFPSPSVILRKTSNWGGAVISEKASLMLTIPTG
jgi:hypothetical protein